MEFQKLYAPSLKELFIRQLQDRILSGELPVGTRLPAERDLARQMQVSRAVVNGGIAELARQGFLEVRPRQGTFVSDYRRTGNMETLLALLRYSRGMLGREEIRSILEVRQSLEHMTVRLAILKGSDDDLAALGRIMEEISLLSPMDGEQASQIAFRFHHELSILGGNRVLPLIYSSFKAPCVSLWVRFCRKHGIQALYQNMRRLYETILARDLTAAEAWIDTYLEEAISGSQQIYEA